MYSINVWLDMGAVRDSAYFLKHTFSVVCFTYTGYDYDLSYGYCFEGELYFYGAYSIWTCMVLGNLVNIGSGKSLLPEGNKPLCEPVLTYSHWV